MRLNLMSYRGVLVTPDVAEALKRLEGQASAKKWRFKLLGPKPGVDSENALSLIPAGREVHFELHRPDVTDAQTALNAAWSCAVPLGFTPWLRHPLVTGSSVDKVFHFLGPWQVLYDRMLAEGRGHLAWPSVCCAAQADVGAWKGDRADERFVQAQLHRIGRNCGPVDGIVGPRTAQALESLGLKRASLAQALVHLRAAEVTAAPKADTHQRGYVHLAGYRLGVSAVGGVKAQQTTSGVLLDVSGPGRVVVDVGGPV